MCMNLHINEPMRNLILMVYFKIIVYQHLKKTYSFQQVKNNIMSDLLLRMCSTTLHLILFYVLKW